MIENTRHVPVPHNLHHLMVPKILFTTFLAGVYYLIVKSSPPEYLRVGGRS